MLERVTVDPDYRVIYGKPDTPRDVSPVWEAAPGNLLVKASKALGAYLIYQIHYITFSGFEKIKLKKLWGNTDFISARGLD